MLSDIAKAKQVLMAEAHTMVLCKNGQIMSFNSSGIITLLDLLETGDLLKGAAVADKVVGKAAAFMMVLGCVNEVFAQLISWEAQQVFLRAGIAFTYEEKTPFIQNRDRTGICPMEKICTTISSPEVAKCVLTEKLNQAAALTTGS